MAVECPKRAFVLPVAVQRIVNRCVSTHGLHRQGGRLAWAGGQQRLGQARAKNLSLRLFLEIP